MHYCELMTPPICTPSECHLRCLYQFREWDAGPRYQHDPPLQGGSNEILHWHQGNRPNKNKQIMKLERITRNLSQVMLIVFFFPPLHTLFMSLNSEKCFFSFVTQSGSFSPFSGVNMSPRVKRNTCTYFQFSLTQNISSNVCFFQENTVEVYQCIPADQSCHHHSCQCLQLFPVTLRDKSLVIYSSASQVICSDKC